MTTPRLALFDIDNTLYKGHVVTDFPKYLLGECLVDEQYINKQERNYQKYMNGEIGYEALARLWLIDMAMCIQGMSVDEIAKYVSEFLKQTDFDYFSKVSNHLKENGYEIYIVSGEPKFVSDYFIQKFDLKGELSSHFVTENNMYTGKVGTLLSNKKAKHEALSDLFEKYNLDGSLAFGDSVVDLEMLGRVKIPICVNPSEELKIIAKERNWRITKTDKLYSTILKIL